jgi:CBS domain-containing protein
MQATQSHKQTDGLLEGEARRRFMRAVLNDLRALEIMVEKGQFETGVSRIGAEQELFLVDRDYHPTPGALNILERLQDTHYTTELGLFNLEMNADPQPFAGRGLADLEAQLTALYDKVRNAGEGIDVQPVLIGILPTIGKTNLGLDNMVPKPRYQALNRAMNEARGEAFDFSIQGIDELVVKHDSVMVEACNASFQVHLQISDPSTFAHHYNLAQMLLGPVLAAGTNSPVLFGRRLWHETRIALFEQSCDVRSPGLHIREAPGRVSFGRDWLRGSVVDLFKENVARFRALVGTDTDEDAVDVLSKGGTPELKALRLHSGTIYRWNRPCYGISENGKPHLRIELRVLPSGPTIADEVANGAFWLGLMSEFGATTTDITQRMDYDAARSNLYAAARDGMSARFIWLDGEAVVAQTLILERLLPMAAAGLARAGVAPDVTARYLGIFERRVRSMQSGTRWVLNSLQAMRNRATSGARMTALVAAMIARQKTEKTVAEWDLATLDENDSMRTGTQRVSQYMQTDIVTVRPDDPIEFVAEIMGWESIRALPVEDERGRLVGLVSYRAVLRTLHALIKSGGVNADDGTSVGQIMKRTLVTVTPDTPMKDAIKLMLKHKIGSLPVVQGEHIVAMITEQDFVGIASLFLANETQPPPALDAEEEEP